MTNHHYKVTFDRDAFQEMYDDILERSMLEHKRIIKQGTIYTVALLIILVLCYYTASSSYLGVLFALLSLVLLCVSLGTIIAWLNYRRQHNKYKKAIRQYLDKNSGKQFELFFNEYHIRLAEEDDPGEEIAWQDFSQIILERNFLQLAHSNSTNTLQFPKKSMSHEVYDTLIACALPAFVSK